MNVPIYHYRRTMAHKPQRDDPEHRLQSRAYQFLILGLPADYDVFSTLNGVYLTPKTRNKAAEVGFRAGPLDLFIVGRGRTYWLEAKIHPRKMSDEQKLFAAKLHPSAWGLFYTLDEMMEIVTKRFGIELKGSLV